MPERTIPRLFEDSAARYGGNVLLWEKTTDKYQGATYSEVREEVRELSAGLVSLGINKGDRIALLSEGRNAWVVSELAILYAGAVNVPFSVKIDEPADLKFRLMHSGCRMAIVSRGQAQKIRRIKHDLPELKTIILLDPADNLEDDETTADIVKQKGRESLQGGGERFDSVWQSVKEGDFANICYTSGTTADPKGIILTHRNYTANIDQSSALFTVPETYVTLLVLPWDHAFAHTCGIYTMIRNGASLAAVQPGDTAIQTLKNIPVNIKETRPTFLLSVPALAKSFRKSIEKGVADKGAVTEKLFQAALGTAYAYNAEGWNRGKGARALLAPLNALFDKVIFRKVRESFGGRLLFFIGGGALLDIELQRFFYAIGIPMYQGYGLTESAPVISSNNPDAYKLGSSGKVAPGLEIKICGDGGNALPAGEQGEICVKGENVMAGYWNNETATKDALRGGWLHTGDLGYMDGVGYLYVIGRTKSLLIASDGEKYSPEGIEETIAERSPYIEQIMLYNSQSPYTAALVVPNRSTLRKWLKDRGLPAQDRQSQEKLALLLKGEIDQYRAGGRYAGAFPERWIPSAFAVLGEGFTEQNRMMNSTMKMVRGKIAEFYKNRLDYLFTPEGKDPLNHQNLTILGRLEMDE